VRGKNEPEVGSNTQGIVARDALMSSAETMLIKAFPGPVLIAKSECS
jgi:hypothetical protein